MSVPFSSEKPYLSLDTWCKAVLHHKCYKIALNAHMTCPNRDGSLDTRGCIFCSRGGSGDFAENLDSAEDVEAQLTEGYTRICSKHRLNSTPSIIAYFQAYTNTYAPISYLEKVYRSALSSQMVAGISIATRPDCLPQAVIRLLITLKAAYPDKFIWIELGLQSIHEATAAYIRRGYSLAVYDDACRRLRQAGIPFIVHVILGLPGEDQAMMLDTISHVNCSGAFGIKLQLLHVLKDTDLAADYQRGYFSTLSMEEYIDLVIDCLEHLSPDIVIHRVTGDGPKNLLISPLWSQDKRKVLNTLHRKMREQHSYQGKKYQKPSEPSQ